MKSHIIIVLSLLAAAAIVQIAGAQPAEKKENKRSITIFDPATVIDHATYTKPDQLSDGIDFTIVNGQIEYHHGKLTGSTAGRILRGRGWHPEAP